MYQVGIVTLSDKGAVGEREDVSGRVIMEWLPKDRFETVSYCLLPDDEHLLSQELIRLSDGLQCDLVLTTGGTGFSARDITPEATRAVATKDAPGIAEGLRWYSLNITKRAMLSRGVSVIRNKTLIINLPGSPKAVMENLECLLDVLPHGLDILSGKAKECANAVSVDAGKEKAER